MRLLFVTFLLQCLLIFSFSTPPEYFSQFTPLAEIVTTSPSYFSFSTPSHFMLIRTSKIYSLSLETKTWEEYSTINIEDISDGISGDSIPLIAICSVTKQEEKIYFSVSLNSTNSCDLLLEWKESNIFKLSYGLDAEDDFFEKTTEQEVLYYNSHPIPIRPNYFSKSIFISNQFVYYTNNSTPFVIPQHTNICLSLFKQFVFFKKEEEYKVLNDTTLITLVEEEQVKINCIEKECDLFYFDTKLFLYDSFNYSLIFQFSEPIYSIHCLEFTICVVFFDSQHYNKNQLIFISKSYQISTVDKLENMESILLLWNKEEIMVETNSNIALLQKNQNWKLLYDKTNQSHLLQVFTQGRHVILSETNSLKQLQFNQDYSQLQKFRIILQEEQMKPIALIPLHRVTESLFVSHFNQSKLVISFVKWNSDQGCFSACNTTTATYCNQTLFECQCYQTSEEGYWKKTSNDVDAVCSTCLYPNLDLQQHCKQCKSGYRGNTCQEFSCFGKWSNDQQVCNGRGICVNLDICKCDTRYDGLECNVFTCFGIDSSDKSSVCNGHGICNDFNLCTCEEGYEGHDCSIWKENRDVFWILILIIGSIAVIVAMIVLIVFGVLFRRGAAAKKKVKTRQDRERLQRENTIQLEELDDTTQVETTLARQSLLQSHVAATVPLDSSSQTWIDFEDDIQVAEEEMHQ